MEGSVIGGVRGRCWTRDEDLVRFGPVQGEFCLEHGGVGVFLGSLTSGDRGVVDPSPTVYGVRGGNGEERP